MRLLLIGPPGAGKGTQARRVAECLDAPHIASGDLLREAIAEGTPLGVQAKEYMGRGDLVPDDLMVRFIAARIRKDDAENFVLDGFPRTDEQAFALDGVLADVSRPLDLVVHLDVPDEEIVRRLSGRRTCPSCQRAYHLVYDPPQTDEVCDDDGTKLAARPDDDPETVRHRLDVYHRATEGLLKHYDSEGLLKTIDGTGMVEEVASRLDTIVAAANPESRPRLEAGS